MRKSFIISVLLVLPALLVIPQPSKEMSSLSVSAREALPAPSALDGAGTFPVRLKEVATGLDYAAEIKHAGDGSGRLFIVQLTGEILILDGTSLLPAPFFDNSAETACCGEKGLRSIAFHPDYASNGNFYVLYSFDTGDPDHPRTHLSRYSVSSNPNMADMASEEILLQLDQPFKNHNGGQLHFGPDGYLYISLGDGGSAGDPGDRSQDLSNLFGTILRIDVDSGTPYGIPPDNPFLEDPDDPNTLSEIWHYGLRNPWRFSFDPLTDDLHIADVGQAVQEEINYLPGGSPDGGNFGWRCYEGDLPYNLTGCGPVEDYIFPVLTHDHQNAPCDSITGGYVYRGTAIAALQGKYIYGDYCSGKVWAAEESAGIWTFQQVFDTDFRITTFGQDQDGELYLVQYHETDGKLFKIVPDAHGVGFYVPSKYRWYFKTDQVDGWSGVISMGWGGASELEPVVGDWDGDGVATAGFYKPSQYNWYLKNDQVNGWAGVSSFNWGGTADLTPIAGDWDGDGDDTMGFFKPATGEWFLKHDLTSGWSGYEHVIWAGAAGNIPIVGDWDGDGDDTIGFFVPSQNKWWLKNDLADGWAGVTGLSFGTADPMEPVTGDWDGDGTDTVGAYVANKWRWYLKDDQVSGWSNVSILRFGPTADYEVLAGDWE